MLFYWTSRHTLQDYQSINQSINHLFIHSFVYSFKVGIYAVLSKNKQANSHKPFTINLKKYIHILKSKKFIIYLQIVQRQLLPS